MSSSLNLTINFNKMTKKEFIKLAEEHLTVLEGYEIDENGDLELKIFGFDKLYEAINFTDSSKVVLTETQDNCLELRKEILEFMEANNYFISTLKTKNNAIGVVDNYLKVYKG